MTRMLCRFLRKIDLARQFRILLVSINVAQRLLSKTSLVIVSEAADKYAFLYMLLRTQRFQNYRSQTKATNLN